MEETFCHCWYQFREYLRAVLCNESVFPPPQKRPHQLLGRKRRGGDQNTRRERLAWRAGRQLTAEREARRKHCRNNLPQLENGKHTVYNVCRRKYNKYSSPSFRGK